MLRLTDTGHYCLATEEGNIDATASDADFSDMVVQMESIIPIPEPASLGLIGLFACGQWFKRRFFLV